MGRAGFCNSTHLLSGPHRGWQKQKDGSTQTVQGYEGALGTKNTYSDNFFAFSHDFNGDGWDDILILGFLSRILLYENPQGKDGYWARHVILDTDNESPTFTDLTGDGKPEIVRSSGGYYGYALPIGIIPVPWTFHPVTAKAALAAIHSAGVGDINGDGRMDMMAKEGWWEQPAFWEETSNGPSILLFSPGGGAQMYAYDVDGDADNDVITSLAAHGYGLAWYEHISTPEEEHHLQGSAGTFMNKEDRENRYGVHFSQLHAIDLIDMNGDGLKEHVTGKRFWAHGPNGDA